jgi:hypothetical protein
MEIRNNNRIFFMLQRYEKFGKVAKISQENERSFS